MPCSQPSWWVVVLLAAILPAGACLRKPRVKESVFSPEIRHRIHDPAINETFRRADSLAYRQDFAQAEVVFSQLLHTELPSPQRLYCLNRLADLNLRLYRDSLARTCLDAMNREYGDLRAFDEADRADYWFNRGRAAYRAFRPEEAKRFLHKSLVAYQRVYGPGHRLVAEAQNALGMVHFEFTRKSDSAVVYIDRARAVYLSTPALQKLRRENELAAGLIRLTDRDHEIGQAYAEVALSLTSEAPWFDTIFYGRALCLLGNMLKKQGNRSEADRCFQQAVESTEGLRDVRRQEFYRDWIVNLIRPDTADRIRFEARMQALRQLLATQGVDRYGHPDRLLGYWYYRRKEFRKTVDYYRMFLPKTDSLTHPLLLEEAAYVLPDAYFSLSGREPALLDSVLHFARYSFLFGTPNAGRRPPLDSLLHPDFYRHIDNPSVYFEFLGKAWAAKRREKDLWRALEVYALADSLLLPNVRAATEGALLTFQFDVGDATYAEALDVAWRCHHLAPTARRPLDLAFRFCERMKSYILFRGLGAYERDSVGRLKKEITGLLHARSSGRDTARSLRLTAAVEQYESIFRRYRYHSEFQLKNVQQALPPLDEVQAGIAEDQAFVEYSLHGPCLYALLISRDTVVLTKQAADSLSGRVEAYRVGLKGPEVKQDLYREQAWALYRILLADLEPFLAGKKRLTIVPDRALHLMPFEALLTAVPAADTFAFLLRRHEIGYAPSWKVWARNRAGNWTGQPRALVFANPEQDTLPYSAEEAALIRSELGAKNVALALDRACSKRNFLARCTDPEFDILHLSLHADSDADDRLKNNIRFGPRDTMYGFELGDCRISARLVVLSACESASGNADAGEGAYSLSRSFLEAGAGQVVATLWPVDNAANAELMSFFYEEIKSGATPDRALHQAKLQMIRKGFWGWVGVVAVG